MTNIWQLLMEGPPKHLRPDETKPPTAPEPNSKERRAQLQREYNRQHKERFIARHGKEAWLTERRKQAKKQRDRKRERERKLQDLQAG